MTRTEAGGVGGVGYVDRGREFIDNTLSGNIQKGDEEIRLCSVMLIYIHVLSSERLPYTQKMMRFRNIMNLFHFMYKIASFITKRT